MSYVADRRWSIEARQRRQMYLDRVRNTTEAFAAKNRERLDALRAQELDIYIAGDYAACRDLLDRVEYLLLQDPEAARDENKRLSAMMRSIGSRARENRRTARVAERDATEAALQAERDAARDRMAFERDARAEAIIREQAVREDLLSMIHQARLSLAGPVERDLCQPDLMALRQEIERSEINLQELDQIQSNLKHRLEAVTTGARTKAEALQLSEQREEAQRDMEAVLEDALAVFSQLHDDVALAEILQLQSRVIGGQMDMQRLDDHLSAIRQAADDRALQEAARRHVVSGLLRELRSAGFVISEPKLEGGEAGAVVIKAQRPSGAQAAFRVKLDEMSYKFDHYQGQACLEDADKVLPKLQDIYGIELGEESISWKNPDMIGKSERRLPDSAGGRSK